MDDFQTQAKGLRRMAKIMSRAQLSDLMYGQARRMGEARFRQSVVRALLEATQPEAVVPRVYEDYRPVVKHGIRFLFQRLSLERLIALSLDQLALPESAGVRQRLITLAKAVPTLHKLGQTIARNKNLDPRFRQWLIQLESGLEGTPVAALHQAVHAAIPEAIRRYDIRMADQVLCEASVGATVAFDWTDPVSGRREKGVFKLIRPGVGEALAEELEILDAAARYFDAHRADYALKDFRFLETFHEIKTALAKEIDLAGEQRHLRRAAQAYAGHARTGVPRLLPFCTPGLTAMAFIPGDKVTHAAPIHRPALARALFKTLLWEPLFSEREHSIFHGDPHAGNLFAFETEGMVKLGLLDWSLCGALRRSQRIWLTRLIFGVLIKDGEFITDALTALAHGGRPSYEQTLALSGSLLADPALDRRNHLERAFFFIDQTARHGIRYPRDLLLFRKAVFTLEGLLWELDPEFDMDRYLRGLLGGQFLQELPRRWLAWCFPQTDTPEAYPSLVSNRDAQMLLTRALAGQLKQSSAFLSELAQKHMALGTRLFMANAFGSLKALRSDSLP